MAKKRESKQYEELVSPDGERKVTPTNATTDAQLRWQGFLPAPQQKEAAKAEASRGDSGSASAQRGGVEKTAGTNGSN